MQKTFYLMLVSLICLFINLIKTDASENNKLSAGIKLMRSDFRVTGASCVPCLRRVAKKLKESTGVLRGDVSIFPPYGGLVIYDASKTNIKTVFKSAYDEHVDFADVETRSISQIPAVLLPKIMPSSQTQTSPRVVR
jgi:hypothetical protein